mmetsp:Transcript_75657/g.208756  ORF Transcript_75657/g.208756 Transcript_75657/m.208756 type:complete len:221 (-) Transcript_75657:477-1139(-)
MRQQGLAEQLHLVALEGGADRCEVLLAERPLQCRACAPRPLQALLERAELASVHPGRLRRGNGGLEGFWVGYCGQHLHGGYPSAGCLCGVCLCRGRWRWLRRRRRIRDARLQEGKVPVGLHGVRTGTSPLCRLQRRAQPAGLARGHRLVQLLNERQPGRGALEQVLVAPGSNGRAQRSAQHRRARALVQGFLEVPCDLGLLRVPQDDGRGPPGLPERHRL